MPGVKASARFRNRKINFRSRISIRTGHIDLPSDHEDDESAGFDDDHLTNGHHQTPSSNPCPTTANNTQSRLLATGVDKDEESELHLQKVIEASTLSLLRSTPSSTTHNHLKQHSSSQPVPEPTLSQTLQTSVVVSTTSTSTSSSSSSSSPAPPAPSSLAPLKSSQTNPPLQPPAKSPPPPQTLDHVPHIPIPDATGLVDPNAYEQLYSLPKLFLPSSYIRFSDTLEDTLGNVLYTMDEDDELWLSEFNKSSPACAVQPPPPPPSSSDEATPKSRRTNSRKGKEKERPNGLDSAGLGPLTEDDFETIMDHFEKVTDETVPGLHLDTSRLPSLSDFEHSLESSMLNPRLSSIKIFAKFVYSHWKERRLKRGGKPIMPAIDFDESNENNPYVCFRRRDIKMVRKTRRTDAQNMERLVSLRDDLYKAQELLNTVLARERLKREAVELEKAIFESRCLMRELKRTLKEPDGDEDLLVSKKEKRRKREGSGNGTTKSPLRQPNGHGINGYSIIPPHQQIHVLRDNAKASVKLMEREYARHREEQAGWEDFTDSCHQPHGLSFPALRWRSAHPSQPALTSKTPSELAAAATVDQGPTAGPSALERHQFRKRVGRGGRFLLDRIVAPRQRARTSPQPDPLSPATTSEQADRQRRLVDRWRFDDDLRSDFPHASDSLIIDDFDIPYSSRRRNMLHPSDLDCLEPHSDTYLNRVAEYLNRVPEPEPPPVKIGKLPSKIVPNLIGYNFGRPVVNNNNLPSSHPGSQQQQQQPPSGGGHHHHQQQQQQNNHQHLSPSPFLPLYEQNRIHHPQTNFANHSPRKAHLPTPTA